MTTLIEPEKKSTEALAATIRAAGKAFSVFDAARLVLQSGDRYHVKFSVPATSNVKLCTIPADGSVWLSREEAVAHFLHSDGIKEFYRVEDIELEEPKGVFNSIAVCGMTGEILGPTSHHSYQTALHRIHRERFCDMRFEDYKRRVRTENSPEIIEKWKESQKHGQVWIYLTPALEEGAEPLKLKSRAEMEAHFRKSHAQNLVHETNDAWVAGNIPKKNLAPSLYFALRRAVEDARKHLLPVAQLLCTGFEGQGLKLFKRRGGKLWVSRTRPKALDNSVVLSDRIAKLVELIKAKPGIATKDLVELVSPSEPKAEAKEAPAPAAEAPVVTDEAPSPAVDETTQGSAEETSASVAEAPAETPVNEEQAVEAVAQVTPETAGHQWTDGQLHALQDLHWLNSEGYVIEYSDGIVFIGVTEPPPPKPKAPKQQQAAESTSAAPSAEAVSAESDPALADETGESSASSDVVESSAESEVTEEPADDEGTSESETEEPAAQPFSFLDDEAPAEADAASEGKAVQS